LENSCIQEKNGAAQQVMPAAARYSPAFGVQLIDKSRQFTFQRIMQPVTVEVAMAVEMVTIFNSVLRLCMLLVSSPKKTFKFIERARSFSDQLGASFSSSPAIMSPPLEARPAKNHVRYSD
jgi:hypothetical protein